VSQKQSTLVRVPRLLIKAPASFIIHSQRHTTGSKHLVKREVKTIKKPCLFYALMVAWPGKGSGGDYFTLKEMLTVSSTAERNTV
jgi:hypothetical protein